EFLVRDFFIHWLYPQFTEGTLRLRTDDVAAYLEELPRKRAGMQDTWTENTRKRVATALLRLGVDFGLLTGRTVKEFASYRLPEKSFLYLLHAITEAEQSPRKVVESVEWRMYLMSRGDVEEELFRLHQYRKIEYEVAGSLMRLKLP